MSEARRFYGLPTNALTPREFEVLLLICEGKSNREIGEEFGRAERTIKQHISAIFEKIKVSNRVQAVVWAIQHGHYSVPPLPSVAQRERTEAAGLQPAGGGD